MIIILQFSILAMLMQTVEESALLRHLELALCPPARRQLGNPPNRWSRPLRAKRRCARLLYERASYLSALVPAAVFGYKGSCLPQPVWSMRVAATRHH